MADTTQFTIGAHVSCSDGPCGEVTRVVIDPVARTVTHLVVEPTHRQGLGRLVPVDLVDATDGQIRLGCTNAAFADLDAAEETLFYPGGIDTAGYGPGQALSWPYYGSTLGFGLGNSNIPLPVVSDSIPLGEVAVRRGQPVRATDGDIGRVQGLVINPADHHVTHVLLQEGHLWGRKQVAIPISAVTSVRDGIEINLARQAVADLPPVDVDPPSDPGGP